MATTYIPGSFVGGHMSGIALTAEFAKIQAALDEAVSRVATTGNSMEEALDMNGHKLLNVEKGTEPGDVATLQNLLDLNVTPVDITALQASVDQLDSDLEALGITAGAANTAQQVQIDALIAEQLTQDAAITAAATTAGSAATVSNAALNQANLNATDITTLQAGQLTQDGNITQLDTDLEALGITAGAANTARLAETTANAAAITAESMQNDTRVAQLRVTSMILPFNATLPDNTVVLNVLLNSPVEILEGGSNIVCLTAPSGGPAQFQLRNNGVLVATMEIADGATVGTVDVLDVSNIATFAGTELFSIHTVAQNGAVDVTLNLKAQRQDIT